MTFRAGFAEIDITPPLGTAKIGWLKMLRIDQIIDPLFARVAVIEADAGAVGFIALDTLSVRWTTVNRLRQRISMELKFPGQNVMVGATHNHAGPALSNTGEVPRDEQYTATLIDRCVQAFAAALKARRPARIGMESVFEHVVAANRRVLMRDGTVRTHGTFNDPNSLCYEDTYDPEVSVLAIRDLDGKPMGVITNFTCHPTHLGDMGQCSAGWPGVYASRMKAAGWPVPLFLQGAAGEIHTSNPIGRHTSMEEAGQLIALDALSAIDKMNFTDKLSGISSRTTTIQLPYRRPSDEEIKGTLRGAQRFVDPKIYDRLMPGLLERIRTRSQQPAEVQAIFVGDRAYVAIPAEYFCRLGLRIKEETFPRRTSIVGYANGMVGYVPTKEACRRGGYETTFAPTSRLSPEAGDMLADAAIALVKSGV